MCSSDLELGFGTTTVNPYEKYRASFHSPVATHSAIEPAQAPKSQSAQASGQWRPAPVAAQRPTAGTVSPGSFTLHSVDEVAEGMEILHERFGRGRITAIDNDPTGAKIVVLFANVEQRKLMLKYAKFQIK